jgi:restriction system protein
LYKIEEVYSGEMVMTKLPTSDQLMEPLIRALQALGGSGSIQEIYDKVVEQEKFPDELLAQLHEPEKSNRTEVAYRLAWARTYLKKYGLLENSTRGIWSLNQKAKEAGTLLDPQEIVHAVRALPKKERESEATRTQGEEDVPIVEVAEEPETEWKQKLHVILTQNLNPGAFERLVQRVLREAGFTQVEVTGRVGDGGIDGRGIARINGLMSFHVLFQCKRYKGAVSAGDMRDFRGALVGRADKGLFITTGTFTPAAVKEATRDGAPPIDMLDGDDLADKLKELGMGVSTKTVEVYTVDEAWFSNI